MHVGFQRGQAEILTVPVIAREQDGRVLRICALRNGYIRPEGIGRDARDCFSACVLQRDLTDRVFVASSLCDSYGAACLQAAIGGCDDRSARPVGCDLSASCD